MDLSAQPPFIGAVNNGDDVGYGHFHGAIDDVMVFQRALSPAEIAAYHNSHAPYATDLVSGAQPDLDDIRITEVSEPEGTAHQVPFEVLGPRPHSDSPCPFDDTDPTTVPHIADREDLCGVVGYWRMDGDATDVGGDHDGMNNGSVPALGRFGDGSGALVFDGGSDYVEVPSSQTFGGMAGLTVEGWVLIDEPDGSSAVLLSRSIEGNGSWEDASFILSWDADTSHLMATVITDAAPHTFTAESAREVSRGMWHHVALRYDGGFVQVFVDGIIDGAVAAEGAVNSNSTALTLGNHSMLGTHNGWLQGTLDDVLIHAVAKSPEYIYRRANPGVPMVRFLASTEVNDTAEDGFDWYDYALHWGDGDATAQQAELAGLDGEECYGLLSPCLGYAGWWRLDEGRGDAAADASTWKHNGLLRDLGGDGLPEWTAARRGTGLSWSGVKKDVFILDADHLHASEGAVEISFTPATDIDGEMPDARVLVNKMTAGQFDDGWLLNISSPTRIVFRIAAVVGEVKDVFTASSVWNAGAWYGLAARFGAGGMDLLTDGAPGQDSGDQDYTGGIGGIGKHLSLGFRADTNPDNDVTWAGALDEVRILSRRLEPDELLHYPAAFWGLGVQVGCVPDCSEKQCGDDGCGGTCGECENPATCNESFVCAETDGNGLTWVMIPSGTFEMGCSPGDTDCLGNDSPPHTVTVAPFELLETEVTEGQFLTVTGAEPSCDYGGGGGADSPVECVTWVEAKAFCNAAGGRLPTEAEWEYAARAGTTTKFPCGTTASCLDAIAWWDANSGIHKHDVRGKAPNAFGLYDTTGNVYEWVEDCWHNTYGVAPSVAFPAWSSGCDLESKVIRGGAYLHDADYHRASFRTHYTTTVGQHHIGFRCARADCDPACDGKDCGDDGCGAYCGTCVAGETCVAGLCDCVSEVNCIDGCCPLATDTCGPDLLCCDPVAGCDGKECGDDGCGGSCGTCGDTEECAAGLCLPLCGNGDCAGDETCDTCPTDCGVCGDGDCCLPQDGPGCGDDGIRACVCAVDLSCCQTLWDQACVDLVEGLLCAVCIPCEEGCGDLEVCDEELDACVADTVAVPSGIFWMGCNAALDDDCNEDEVPYHQVYLEGFNIDLTEVTNAQYAYFLNILEKQGASNECPLEGDPQPCVDPWADTDSLWVELVDGTWTPVEGKDLNPVGEVTWFGARAYCEWTGKALCTEAQFEKAARGGCEMYDDCEAESWPFPWGPEPVSYQMNYYINSNNECGGGPGFTEYSPCPVGTTEPESPYGAYHLGGNAHEWVADWYAGDYYCDGPDADCQSGPQCSDCLPTDDPYQAPIWLSPEGPPGGTMRVLRGGGYNTSSYNQRVSHRLYGYPSSPSFGYSFRCCGPCVPDCDGKQCGDDGCGVSCGSCTGQDVCVEGQCMPTWTDSVSGLVWQVTPTGGKIVWDSAVTHCLALSPESCNWQLPTVDELRTLIRGCLATEDGGNCNVEADDCLSASCRDDSCDGCPYMEGPENGCYWPDEMQGNCYRYWSSSAVADGGQDVWVIHFVSGAVAENNVGFPEKGGGRLAPPPSTCCGHHS